MSLEPARKTDARLPVSPQMALRIAVLGTVALVMFGIIFFRLWYLQILAGNKYAQQDLAQQQRPLPIAPPRGQMLARNGEVLVASKTTNAVQVVPSELPPGISAQVAAYAEAIHVAVKRAERAGRALKRFESDHVHLKHLPRSARRELRGLERGANAVANVRVPRLPAADQALRSVFKRLGRVIHLSPRTIDVRTVQGAYLAPYAPVTIDASAGPGPRTVIGERAEEFPGVQQRPVAVRSYPHGEMAAQIFGNVGQITGEELAKGSYKGLPRTSIVGQGGLEYYYDKFLRGKPGVEYIEVNAAGEAVPGVRSVTEPKAGYSLKLTLDMGLQQAGERALRKEISAANAVGKPADGGAFVVLNPLNGEVFAMGSYPGYDPSVFTRPISNGQYARLFPAGEPASGGQPLLNRAVQAAYPTGSTFKPITAIGALEAGAFDPYEDFGGGQCLEPALNRYCNAESVNYAATDLVHALEESSDTYFYTVGKRANGYGPVIQKMAHRLGIGRATGIDLPNDPAGVVPDAKWLQRLVHAERVCTREEGKSCNYVSEPNETWTYGDNMNLAVGQGSLQTSPLQMAVAYSALVNAFRTGGEATVVRPHLGLQIDEADGGLVQALKFRPRRRFHLNPTYVDLIFEGLHDAATGPQGTSTPVWTGWNQSRYPVYGKTGTAERPLQETQAWYMCYIGSEARPIVIATTVEQGGYGAETAAPIARTIANAWLRQQGQAEG